MRSLFLTASPPFPPISGDRQRSNLLHRALSRLGSCDTIVMLDGHYPEMIERLRSEFGLVGYTAPTPRGCRGPWRAVRHISPRVVDRVAVAFGRRSVDYAPDPAVMAITRQAVQSQHYDLIVGRFLRPAAKMGVLEYTPSLVDIDDVDTQLYQSRISNSRLSSIERSFARWHLAQIQALLPGVIAKASHVMLASDADMDIVDHPRKTLLRNVPYFELDQNEFPAATPVPNSGVVLVVATMNLPMNWHGTLQFATRSWPTVRAACPHARFRVVGAGMEEWQRDALRGIDGVEPIGFVENLAEEYASAQVVVSPVHEGGGTKLKVLEALRYGRPVVVTPLVARGFAAELPRDVALRVAEDDSGFATQVMQLLSDLPASNALAEAGRGMTQRHFGFAKFARTVEEVAVSLTELGRPLRPRESST